MKKFTKFELATLKRTAQNVNPMVSRKTKLQAQIDEAQAEINSLQVMIDSQESHVRTLTGGYSTEDLIQKVITDTGKVDKNGQAIKVTKYVFKYPDTIVPSCEETLVSEINEMPYGCIIDSSDDMQEYQEEVVYNNPNDFFNN